MIRQFLITVAIAFLTVAALFSSPLSTMAEQYSTSEYSAVEYSQSLPASSQTSQPKSQQESQSYPSQSAYKKSQDASDYSYTDKQIEPSKPQVYQPRKQTNQMAVREKQYVQRSQSSQSK